MTPKEFNLLTKNILKARLSDSGFKLHKDIFYIHKSPNILVLTKHYQKDYFHGFYIGMTHDFLTTAKNDANELALTPFLEDYPFTISVEDLESQYHKFKSVNEFEYDTNFISRVILPTRKETNPIFSMYDKIRYNENLATTIVNSVADKTIEFGLRLFNEYNPNVSYQSVTRHRKANDFKLEMFKTEIEKYCLENNIPLQKRKRSWFPFFR